MRFGTEVVDAVRKAAGDDLVEGDRADPGRLGPDRPLQRRDRNAPLRGAVGGSRVAVDNGWIPRERQIGQPGKTVSPRPLVSCGISGAHARVSAIRDAGVIVAINIGRNAPIRSRADLAVVGDMRAILPALPPHPLSSFVFYP